MWRGFLVPSLYSAEGTQMKIATLAAAMVIVGMPARPEQIGPILPALNDPQVIGAMKNAWAQTVNGSTGVEATFRLDGSPSEYKVVVLPFSNEFRKQKVLIIPGKTFAVFHVHPTVTNPAPSAQDRTIADKFKMKILTIHRRGMYEYDPVTKKTTRLRHGLDWLNPIQD